MKKSSPKAPLCTNKKRCSVHFKRYAPQIAPFLRYRNHAKKSDAVDS